MRYCLLVAVTLALTSNQVSAGSNAAPKPATPTTPASLVTAKLIQPLAAKETEHSKFSRARLPPSERRVRVLDEKPQQDTGGDAFYTFAVDEKRGWSDDSAWNKAKITGCVYPDRGEVFIKRGNAFHPAVAATGKKTKAAPERTCQAGVQLSAKS